MALLTHKAVADYEAQKSKQHENGTGETLLTVCRCVRRFPAQLQVIDYGNGRCAR